MLESRVRVFTLYKIGQVGQLSLRVYFCLYSFRYILYVKGKGLSPVSEVMQSGLFTEYRPRSGLMNELLGNLVNNADDDCLRVSLAVKCNLARALLTLE